MCEKSFGRNGLWAQYASQGNLTQFFSNWKPPLPSAASLGAWSGRQKRCLGHHVFWCFLNFYPSRSQGSFLPLCITFNFELMCDRREKKDSRQRLILSQLSAGSFCCPFCCPRHVGLEMEETITLHYRTSTSFCTCQLWSSLTEWSNYKMHHSHFTVVGNQRTQLALTACSGTDSPVLSFNSLRSSEEMGTVLRDTHLPTGNRPGLN